MQVSSTSHPTPPVKPPANERPHPQQAQETQPKPTHAQHHAHHHKGKHVDKTA